MVPTTGVSTRLWGGMDSQGPDPQRNGSARDRTVTADEDRRSPCTAIASVTVYEPLQSGGAPRLRVRGTVVL